MPSTDTPAVALADLTPLHHLEAIMDGCGEVMGDGPEDHILPDKGLVIAELERLSPARLAQMLWEFYAEIWCE